MRLRGCKVALGSRSSISWRTVPIIDHVYLIAALLSHSSDDISRPRHQESRGKSGSTTKTEKNQRKRRAKVCSETDSEKLRYLISLPGYIRCIGRPYTSCSLSNITEHLPHPLRLYSAAAPCPSLSLYPANSELNNPSNPSQSRSPSTRPGVLKLGKSLKSNCLLGLVNALTGSFASLSI